MSVELIAVLIAVLAVGGTLAGMILTGNRGLRQDMARLESRLVAKIDGLESRLVARIDGTGIAAGCEDRRVVIADQRLARRDRRPPRTHGEA